MRTPAEVGELTARLFDRLETSWPNCEVQDVVLAAEIIDPEDPDATIMLIEATTPRTTVRAGILDMARDAGVEREEFDSDDDANAA